MQCMTLLYFKKNSDFSVHHEKNLHCYILPAFLDNAYPFNYLKSTHATSSTGKLRINCLSC